MSAGAIAILCVSLTTLIAVLTLSWRAGVWQGSTEIKLDDVIKRFDAHLEHHAGPRDGERDGERQSRTGDRYGGRLPP